MRLAEPLPGVVARAADRYGRRPPIAHVGRLSALDRPGSGGPLLSMPCGTPVLLLTGLRREEGTGLTAAVVLTTAGVGWLYSDELLRVPRTAADAIMGP